MIVAGLALLPAPAAGDEDARPERVYEVDYVIRLVPSERGARVSVRVGGGARHLRALRFRVDPERHTGFRADGELEVGRRSVLWRPPRGGGVLRYRFLIDHTRDSESYDARCGSSYALFRGDDLVPPARVRTAVGARSRSRLRFHLPRTWSVVTPYPREDDGSFRVDHPDRRFDRPTGWILAGRLGVVRETVAGVRVAVAGPVGHGVRRLDLLALLRWTLPTLRRITGALPDRLLVVSAGDPMWRGGLSGRNSVYIHADRPLITSDVTSPLLHELIHTVMRARSGPGGDWISEGLAELYSLELLARSRTVGRRRYERALRRMEQRARAVPRLVLDEVRGAATARAVLVLRALDRELERRGGGGLDAVLRELVASPRPITTERLREVSEKLCGCDLAEFFRKRVPRPEGAGTGNRAAGCLNVPVFDASGGGPASSRSLSASSTSGYKGRPARPRPPTTNRRSRSPWGPRGPSKTATWAP